MDIENNNIEVDLKRYNAIDIARFICAFLVVIIHVPFFGDVYDIPFQERVNFYTVQYLCRIAVPLFFCFSGFFLFRNVNFEQIDYKKLLVYTVRILKLYGIWTLIYWVLWLYKLNWDIEYFIKCFMLEYLWKCIVYQSYQHLWYLNALAVAIVLITGLLYLKIKPGIITVVAFVLYLIGILGDAYYGVAVKPVGLSVLSDWYEKYFYTTRNGVFFGFFFVALGMVFAYNKVKLPKRAAIIGVVLSYALGAFEVYELRCNNYARDYNMCLWIIPATFFMMSFLLEEDLRDKAVYGHIRLLSQLVFYSHLLIRDVLLELPLSINFYVKVPLPMRTIIVFAISLALSEMILLLSGRRYGRWLKALY